MVIEFEAELPIGARTCCDLPSKSGKYGHTWLMTDVDEFDDEYQALQRGDLDKTVRRSEHLDAVAQIGSLMKRAASGQLPVGREHNFPARVIRRLSYLLELRPALTSRASRSRVFRLYYAEPKHVESALLPLVLNTKAASSDNEEQNASIDEAKVRSRKWVLNNVIGGSK